MAIAGIPSGWRARQDAARKRLEHRRETLYFNQDIRSQRAMAIAAARGEAVEQEPLEEKSSEPVSKAASKPTAEPAIVAEASASSGEPPEVPEAPKRRARSSQQSG